MLTIKTTSSLCRTPWKATTYRTSGGSSRRTLETGSSESRPNHSDRSINRFSKEQRVQQYRVQSDGELFLQGRGIQLVALLVVDDADRQGAAGTLGDVFTSFDLLEGDEKLVAAGAWVVKFAGLGVEVEVFDLDFVVDACLAHCSQLLLFFYYKKLNELSIVVWMRW